MEPMNCTAAVTETACQIWAPTQNPAAVAASVSSALDLPLDSIKVTITHMGGGFGRRLNADYAVEAALISRAVGAPVKVTWTREDDVAHGYYRPMTLHRLSAGIDAEGLPLAWKHRVASLSFMAFLSGPEFSGSEFFLDEFPANHVPNYRAEFTSAESEVPRGWWRSVTSSANPFAIESFLDEVAINSGFDPIELRLRLLGEDRTLPYRLPWAEDRFDTQRMKAVIRLAAEKARWGSALPKGTGRGFASHFFSPTYIAQVAEVSIAADGTPRVKKIVSAVDCGIVVNPNIAHAQVEGGILFGLSAALREQITVKNGRVAQSNFHDYPVLRINEIPEVEVHFVSSTEPPSGLGEVGVPPVAAAVCNAIFAATGRRIRRLPISMDRG
jgi:isoquinoline 1-oxidoreductase beta subunit